LDRREERLVSKFEQFSDARIELFTAVQFFAFVDNVVQIVDVSSIAKAGQCWAFIKQLG